MSHIAKVDIQLKDQKCVEEAAKRLGVKTERVTNYKFYDGTIATGTAVYLKGWRYPLVIKDDGEAVYDNYNGAWGENKYLNELKQIYGVEVAKKQARLKGYTCIEQKGSDGKITLKISV
jgi:hypothetical protein